MNTTATGTTPALPAMAFSPNTWHHIQWYVQTNHSNHTYHYVSLVVDGVPYTVNQTYSAKNLHWGTTSACSTNSM